MTDDDLFAREQLAQLQHSHEIELEKLRHDNAMAEKRATSTKIARIQAKRDVKVARAGNKAYMEMSAMKIGLIAAVFALASVGGCTAYVYGGPNSSQKDKLKSDVKIACTEKGYNWDATQGGCYKPGTNH